MPRFAGLSQPFVTFPGLPDYQMLRLPVLDENGAEIVLGNNGVTTPHKEWRIDPPIVPQDWHQLGLVTGTATPDAVVDAANPPGATHPDLVVVPGSAGSGGGVSLGTVALLALLAVGGWFLYKRFA